MSFEASVDTVLADIKATLIEKNRKYGNSALEPARVFSKTSPVEQLLVRIDDKISRIQSGQGDDTEDAVKDLLGYLVLLRIARSPKADQKPSAAHTWLAPVCLHDDGRPFHYSNLRINQVWIEKLFGPNARVTMSQVLAPGLGVCDGAVMVAAIDQRESCVSVHNTKGVACLATTCEEVQFALERIAAARLYLGDV